MDGIYALGSFKNINVCILSNIMNREITIACSISFGCRLISLLIIVALIAGWKNIAIPFELVLQQHNINSWSIFLVIMGSAFLLLNMFAALGLFLIKKWGFISAYAAILFSTIFFSASYLPLVNKIFPASIQYIPLIVNNLIVLSYTVYLHIQFQKKGQPKN